MPPLNSKLKRNNLKQEQKIKKRAIDQFNTNTPLKYYQGREKPIYFLPAYIRAKVISISELKYEEMSAQLNVQLFITILFRGVKFELHDDILNKGIKLSFEKGPCITLSRDNPEITIRNDPGNNTTTFIIRKFIATSLICDYLIWAPFEVIECRLSMILNRIRIPEDNSQMVHEFHFNLMDHEDDSKKIISSVDSNFGIFAIVSAHLKAEYTKSLLHLKSNEPVVSKPKPLSKKKKKLKKGAEHLPLLKKNYGKERPDAFNAAHFRVPLYKKPMVAIVTIFLPLLMMAIINLGIFYQKPDLHKRIISISALMVSLVALVPTIRQQIPPTPQITFVEILVFLESLTTLFALFDSLSLGYEDVKTFHLSGSHLALFIVSVIITVLVNLIVVIFLACYKLKWKPSYTVPKHEIEIDFDEEELESYQWSNNDCDKEFVRFYDNRMIEVIEQEQANMNMLYKFGLNAMEEEVEMKEQRKREMEEQEQTSLTNLVFKNKRKKKR